MPHIQLKGNLFYVTGRFSKSQREIAQELTRHGARLSDQVSKSLHCMIAGAGSTGQQNKARSRGIPILNETQYEALLAEGELDFEPAPEITVVFDFGEALGELRSLFDGPPTSETWTRCLEIVEQCDAARHPDLVAYIAPMIARWDQLDALPPWQPPAQHALMTGAERRDWPNAVARQDELRQAPPLWIMEMLRGEHSPKHGLVRAITLHDLRTNSTGLRHILDNPHLAHLTHLSLGARNSFSQGIFEELLASRLASQLTYLHFGAGETESTRLIQAALPHLTPLPALTTLHLELDPYVKEIRELVCFANATITTGNWRWSTEDHCHTFNTYELPPLTRASS